MRRGENSLATALSGLGSVLQLVGEAALVIRLLSSVVRGLGLRLVSIAFARRNEVRVRHHLVGFARHDRRQVELLSALFDALQPFHAGDGGPVVPSVSDQMSSAGGNRNTER